MVYKPYSITMRDLAAAGRDHIPRELRTDTGLIYNSPAALDFNSPGAQGFGVKRAGLAIPESIMLLLAPGCCGRNTAAIEAADHYGERFAYFLLDENDIVTGRHLTKVPEAVKAFVASRQTRPSVVMLCITCVDALLGTDMERVCRKASEACGLPVLPSYMYALTRDSRKPPMTAIRQTIYSLLEPRVKDPAAVNLLGHFAPLMQDSELYALLRTVGIRSIREIARCDTYDQYQQLAEANFNLVLNPEAAEAADWFKKQLSIPSIELKRLYQLDKIRRQYQSLGQVLGVELVDDPYHDEALAAVKSFTDSQPGISLGIGSRLNANPFELALAMVRYGLHVEELYAIPQPSDFFYIRRLADLCPDIRLYMNLSPSMVNYTEELSPVDFTLGADAAYYHPHSRCVSWNDEQQPFGYQAVRDLFRRMKEVFA